MRNFLADFSNNRQNSANCALRFPFLNYFRTEGGRDGEEDGDGERGDGDSRRN